MSTKHPLAGRSCTLSCNLVAACDKQFYDHSSPCDVTSWPLLNAMLFAVMLACWGQKNRWSLILIFKSYDRMSLWFKSRWVKIALTSKTWLKKQDLIWWFSRTTTSLCCWCLHLLRPLFATLTTLNRCHHPSQETGKPRKVALCNLQLWKRQTAIKEARLLQLQHHRHRSR